MKIRVQNLRRINRLRQIERSDPLIDGPERIICILTEDETERRREWVPLIL
jgi:hypothetical protein